MKNIFKKKKPILSPFFTNISQALLIKAGDVSELRMRNTSVGSKTRREFYGFETFYFMYSLKTLSGNHNSPSIASGVFLCSNNCYV